MVEVIFAPDTRWALFAATEVVNTLPGLSASREDELVEQRQLVSLLDRIRFTGRRDGDEAELAAVRALRTRLQAAWELERDDGVPLINELLAEGNARPRLIRHDDEDWHIHATENDDPLVMRMQVEAAMALLDVARADEWDRLRVCASEECSSVLVDLTRNRSKRFCDVRKCGNRENARAYRARRDGRASTGAVRR